MSDTINILCFGDSNTWGHTPGTGLRFPADVRWTGVCQNELGPRYKIWEQGLNGRTSVFDDVMPFRNGEKALGYVLQTVKPLDLAVIMLGTNDVKFADAEGVAEGVGRLVDIIQTAQKNIPTSTPFFPNCCIILLISPIIIGDKVQVILENRNPSEEHEISLHFYEAFRKLAEEKHVYLIDAAEVAKASEIDGLHMDADSHRALGLRVASEIRKILETS